MRPEEKLFDAITGIDEGLVDSAQSYVFHKQPRTWQRIASLAACLLIVASIGFGMLQLAGIGGMGGSNTAADAGNAAPPENNVTTDNGATGSGGATGDDSGVDQGAAVEETVFTATVLEIGDGYLLVEPVEGDPMLATADQIQVPVDGVELPDGVTTGTVLTITFSGGVMESYPAQIADIISIVLADG